MSRNQFVDIYITAKNCLQFDVAYDDVGMYKCKAQTRHHISTSTCILDISQFDVIVTPSTLEIEIGSSAIFTCEISAIVPDWLQNSFTYKWSRGDNVAISSNAIGVNSPILQIVSVLFLHNENIHYSYFNILIFSTS